MTEQVPPEVRNYFSKLGRKGGKKGGRARADNMTPAERVESARNAVLARWKNTGKIKPRSDK